MNKCMDNFRNLRVRDVGVIIAMILGLGGPLSLVLNYLFGPSERVSALLSSRFAFSLDALTALTMAVFCLVLGLFMLVGDRFFRRFLHQP